MQVNIQEAKATMRQQVQAELRKISPTDRQAASAQARALLEKQKLWTNAGSVLLFAPMAEELDVWPLASQALLAGKRVALPRFQAETKCYCACVVQDLGRDVATGRFGIREPVERCPKVSLNQLDLILVPGVAFDLHGRRLGRGKGYYDQMLADLRGIACGVAFDQQIVGEVPVAPHDVILNCILTPTRWLEL